MTAVDRRFAMAAAAVVTVAAWTYTVREARNMAGGMAMPGGWSMSMTWMAMGGQSVLARAVMFLTMWTVMMVAMMLPSVMPVVLLHRKLIAARGDRGDSAGGSNLLLLAGYFGVWVGFGAIAYAAGTSIAGAAMRSASFSRAIPIATGVALVAAGVYQLTNVKQACLSHCRSPLEFFAHHPIRSRVDSLKFGLHHGAYCAACCWALMLIQLVLGVMSLPLMAAIALVIYLEKSWRYGPELANVVGVAAVVSGVLFVLR